MLTGYIEEALPLRGKIETPDFSNTPSADSDHYTISVGGYEFVSVAVETIETESEEEE